MIAPPLKNYSYYVFANIHYLFEHRLASRRPAGWRPLPEMAAGAGHGRVCADLVHGGRVGRADLPAAGCVTTDGYGATNPGDFSWQEST